MRPRTEGHIIGYGAALAILLLAGLLWWALGCGYQPPQTQESAKGVGYGGPARQSTVHDPTVVLVGDSVMSAWLTPAVLAANPMWTAQTSPAGVEETTTQILARFPAALALAPNILVIQAGTWDMSPANQTAPICNSFPSCKNIQDMIIAAKAAGIYTIVCTIPPWGDGPLAQSNGLISVNVAVFNANETNDTGNAGVDLFGLLTGQPTWYAEGPGEYYEGPYIASYTNDGINPNSAAQPLIVQAVQAAITASKVGGAR
jgi:hypothetical protein